MAYAIVNNLDKLAVQSSNNLLFTSDFRFDSWVDCRMLVSNCCSFKL